MIHRQRVNFALILEYAQGLDLLPLIVVTGSKRSASSNPISLT